MKKILFIAGLLLSTTLLMSQDSTRVPARVKPSLANRPNDHFLVQLGYHGWNNIPDTINRKGISKTFNVYFMFDFPFKTNPKLSMAFGPGIASDHMLFEKTAVGIKENAPQIFFTDLADTNHFKKTKLATVWLEAPIEFRYTADPYTGKGFKLAVGVKVGTLLNAHTRNAKFQSKSETSINDFVSKETSKRFFNRTRLSGMLRAGYGHFSLFGSYSFTPLFKDALGPEVRPFSIGLTLSGL